MVSLEFARSENRTCPSIDTTSGTPAIQFQRLYSLACGNSYPYEL
jgi:hypothetical protein